MNFDIAFTSNLQRAFKTCETIRSHLDHDFDIIQSENLNEIAKEAQAEADEAEKDAEQNQIKAMEASNLSGTLNDEILQKPATDASKQGTKIAEEASNKRLTLNVTYCQK